MNGMRIRANNISEGWNNRFNNYDMAGKKLRVSMLTGKFLRCDSDFY